MGKRIGAAANRIISDYSKSKKWKNMRKPPPSNSTSNNESEMQKLHFRSNGEGSPANDKESVAKAKEISDLLHLHNNRPFLMENFTTVKSLKQYKHSTTIISAATTAVSESVKNLNISSDGELQNVKRIRELNISMLLAEKLASELHNISQLNLEIKKAKTEDAKMFKAVKEENMKTQQELIRYCVGAVFSLGALGVSIFRFLA